MATTLTDIVKHIKQKIQTYHDEPILVYIGIGTKSQVGNEYTRAFQYSISNRSKWWHNVYNKSFRWLSQALWIMS